MLNRLAAAALVRAEGARDDVVVLYCEPEMPEYHEGDEDWELGSFVTLIIGIRAIGGIVVVGDGRATLMSASGRLQLLTDAAKKLHNFDRYIVGFSGSSAPAEDLLDSWREKHVLNLLAADGAVGPPTVPSLKDTALVMEHRFRGEFRNRFGSDVSSWPLVSFLVAGYESPGGSQGIYRLESGNRFIVETKLPARIGEIAACACVDSLRRVLIGDDSQLTIAQAKAFAVLAVNSVAVSDLSVGGEMQLAVLTPDGYTDASSEVSSIEQRNVALLRRLRAAISDGPGD